MSPKNAAAVALGRRGGLARAQRMTKQQRSEAARKAVEARWAKTEQKLAESHTQLEAAMKKLERAQKKLKMEK